MRVHFICRGNTYRSIIAEAYLKSLHIPSIDVISSGTVAKEYSIHNIPINHFTQNFLERKGLQKYAKNTWNDLTQDRISNSDVTICMNQRVMDECMSRVVLPTAAIVWNINDNDAKDTENPPNNEEELLEFTENVFEQIKIKVDELAQSLK